MNATEIKKTMEKIDNQNLKLYNIVTKDLLEKYAGKNINYISEEEKDILYDKVSLELIDRVASGEIWFPFQKYFRGKPHDLFSNLRTINLNIQTGAYRLHSYYPKYSTYMPPKFRGTQIKISGIKKIYDKADVLSDHFIENIRLKAKRHDQTNSILECWAKDNCLKEIMKVALKKEVITPETLRDSIYEIIPETKIFNPTWARALLKVVMNNTNLKGKKWLDISAGWGDRLLAAMSLDMEYVGFDPNIELKDGHSAMIESFGDKNKHKIIYEPFEKAKIPPGPYDVILSSPPYFDIEEYAPNQDGQSIVNYPSFNQWIVWFLFASLSKAWDNLSDNGYLILHLGDSKTVHMCESTNIFIENYLSNSSWEGIIGLLAETGYPRPVWVWKKVPQGFKRTLWEPIDKDSTSKKQLRSVSRTLFNTYPHLQSELISFYGSKFSSDYIIRKGNANTIRDYVSLAFPNISRENIDKILQDDLLISSLLESLNLEDTIKWGISMIKLSFRN